MIRNQPFHLSKGQDIACAHHTQDRYLGNTPRVLISALTFGLFLILGIWSGSIAAKFSPARGPMATLSAISPPPTPANGQTNLLIIGVDRLNIHNPGLESIWLLGYFADKPHISLVPVYPSLTGPSIQKQSEIISSIQLTDNGHPSPELVKFLRKERIWWNGYVILDAAALIEIVDFLGGVHMDGRPFNGALAVSSFPPPSEDFSAALTGQTKLLRSMCIQTNLLAPSVDLRDILNLIPDHLQTDVDIFESVRIWRQLVNGGGDFVCEFPLMKASLP